MPKGHARVSKAETERIVQAAAKAGKEVRWEFRPDRTVVATTVKPGEASADDECGNEWDEVFKNGAPKPQVRE
jgi:hypothetical protein